MKPKLLFVFDHVKPHLVEKDGLWTALNLLEEDFEITRTNIAFDEPRAEWTTEIDFTLGWGAFDSRVDQYLANWKGKKGLCLAAQFPVNETAKDYDLIFYETESIKHWLEAEGLTKLKHAFGINTDVYKKMDMPKVWDYITVGSFSSWHRQEKLIYKGGYNLAVGGIQQDNLQESLSLLVSCAMSGWVVSGEVTADQLAQLYNMSKKAYLPAAFGQERAVLEARACGLEVEIEPDNPKLKELLTVPIWDHHYYAKQLKEGIMTCL